MSLDVRQREVEFRSYTTDPLNVAKTLGMTSIQPRDPGKEFVPAPGWLQAALTNLKVPHPEKLSNLEAMKIRDHLLRRLHKGLASHSQVAYLISLGVGSSEAKRMKFKEAQTRIDQLKGNS